MALNPEPTETFALGKQTISSGVVSIMEEPPEAERKPPALPMSAQPKDIILFGHLRDQQIMASLK